MDIIISLAWFAAFGVLVDGIHRLDCGSIWQWGIITQDSVCGRWKAAEAFSFLSAIVWLVSGLVVSIYYLLSSSYKEECFCLIHFVCVFLFPALVLLGLFLFMLDVFDANANNAF